MTETHHYGSEAGTTYKWYDGDDRLVEVQQPHDPRTFASGNAYDLFSFAWSTRYLYDLSQNGQVTLDGASFHAYGNLYKTQEYLPGTPVVSANSAPAAPVWSDVRGTSFDALDRPLASRRCPIQLASSRPRRCFAKVCRLKSSSRTLPLSDSMLGFCVGMPS